MEVVGFIGFAKDYELHEHDKYDANA